MRIPLALSATIVGATLGLAGCATTAGMNRDLQGEWIGKPANSFFIGMAPPTNQYPTQDGQTVYTWSKRCGCGYPNLLRPAPGCGPQRHPDRHRRKRFEYGCLDHVLLQRDQLVTNEIALSCVG